MSEEKMGPIPVEEGQVLEEQVIGIGEKGDGIVKVNGFVLVVPKAEKSKYYRIKVTAIRGRVGFAEILEEIAKENSEE